MWGAAMAVSSACDTRSVALVELAAAARSSGDTASRDSARLRGPDCSSSGRIFGTCGATGVVVKS